MRPIAELRDAAVQPADRDMALFELGMALDRRGESAAAIAAVREAATLKPDEPHYQLGLAWLLAHRAAAFEEAVESGRRALALEPTMWKAAGLLCWLLGRVLGRHVEARPLGVRAVEINPDARVVYASMCRAWLDEDRVDRLRARIEAAAPPRARRDLLGEGLAAALMQVGRYDEARRLAQDLVRIAPDHVLFRATLAEAETVLGDDDAAAHHLEHALQLAPANDDMRIGYLSSAWRSGDRDRITAAIAAGTAASGPSRLTRRDAVSAGDTVRGQTVLLTEIPNDYGDPIQWARTAPMLQARGGRAILECRQPLRALFETTRGAPAVVVPHDPYPPYNQRVAPFWLPLGWSWEELDCVPYFDVPQPVRQAWAERVHGAGGGVHVGLVWRSGDELPHKDNPYCRRTIPLRQLEPIVTMSGTTCHTLNVVEAVARDVAAIETALPLSDLLAPSDDFLQAAAVICALDIVVTVDTAFAHLAGALAKPTFLMLPYAPDWRWGRHRTILGYPTIRPFRQPAPGDWVPVIADVQEALRTFVREHPRQDVAYA